MRWEIDKDSAPLSRSLTLASVLANVIFYVLFHFAVITSVLAQAAGLMFQIYTIFARDVYADIYIYMPCIQMYMYSNVFLPDQTQIKD